MEGTLNPEVIEIIKVLAAIRLSRRKAKRDRDTGKRQTELGHFKIRAASVEEMENNIRETGKWTAKNNTLFSHMASVKSPPPYKKEVKSTDATPQVPGISQQCNYHIKDEDE